MTRWFSPLRRSGEIAHVRRRGARAATRSILVFATRERPGAPAGRVAIAIPKAVGNAVVRNRIKRRLKGALDAMPPPPAPIRAVLVVKPEAAAESYAGLAAELAAALGRLR